MLSNGYDHDEHILVRGRKLEDFDQKMNNGPSYRFDLGSSEDSEYNSPSLLRSFAESDF